MPFGNRNEGFQSCHEFGEALGFVFPEIEDHAGCRCDEAVGDDGGAASVDGVHAVESADDGCDIGDFRFASGDAFFALEGAHGSHCQKIRDKIDDYRQIDEDIKLFQKGRADCAECQDALDEYAGANGQIRRIHAIHTRKIMREMAERGAVSYDFGNSELPSRKGNEAGNDEHARHDDAGCFSKHRRISQAKRCQGADELGMRDDAADDRGRKRIDGPGKERAAKDGNRDIFGRIFDGFRIRARRFQTQESPENDGDGITHGDRERRVIRIPSGHVDFGAKACPTEGQESQDRRHDAHDTESRKRPAFLGPPKLIEAASAKTPIVAKHTMSGESESPKKNDA